MHLRLTPGAVAVDSLKSIAAELQEVPRIHEINVMGQSVDDQAVLMLSELNNTTSIIIRDISISEATLETLRASLPDCSVETCDSSHDDVHYNLNMAMLLGEESIDAGIHELTEQIRTGFDLELAHCVRGAFYEDAKEYEKAIADYTAAIKIEPEYCLAYWNRGDCYEALGNDSSAEADYTRAKELGYEP